MSRTRIDPVAHRLRGLRDALARRVAFVGLARDEPIAALLADGFRGVLADVRTLEEGARLARPAEPGDAL